MVEELSAQDVSAQDGNTSTNAQPLTRFHPSRFENYRYAYPVVSRRARGVSVGVNLSPTRLCNYRCVYCQVARDGGKKNVENRVDVAVLKSEALEIARSVLDGSLFHTERFAPTPESRRVLRDFAFSGDGEPTLAPQFAEVVDALVDARNSLDYPALKLVLITNATRLRAPEVADALDRLVDARGEIWAKLDAVDDATLREYNRSTIPFETVLDNIRFAAQRWTIKIQTALFSWRGVAPDQKNAEKYVDTLNRLLTAGGKIAAVQLYTVARVPAESAAQALSDEEMDRRAEFVRRETGLDVEVFYSK